MFTGFTDDTVRFLMDLKFHNNTTYFHEQHERYIETVQTPFYDMIEALAPEMRKITGSFSAGRRNRGTNAFSIILNSGRTGSTGAWESGEKTGN